MWSMELADYNITFLHTKGKNNIFADTNSRLKMLHINKEQLEDPKAQVVNNTQLVVAEKSATHMLCCNNENSFKSVTLSASGILQKHQKTDCLQHDSTKAPYSLVTNYPA